MCEDIRCPLNAASTHPFGEPRPLCFRFYDSVEGNYAFAITWDDRWSRIHELHCAFEYHHPSNIIGGSQRGPIVLQQCTVHGLTGELNTNRFMNMHTMIEIGKLRLWMKLMKLPLS